MSIEEVFARLDELSTYGKGYVDDGWDAVNSAVVAHLRGYFNGLGEGARMPAGLYPTPDGGIVVSWSSSEKTIEDDEYEPSGIIFRSRRGDDGNLKCDWSDNWGGHVELVL